MKHLFSFVICAFLTFVGMAQTNRFVHGSIVDFNGVPMPNAELYAIDANLTFKPDTNGYFAILVPSYVTEIEVSCVGCFPVKRKIDGSYLKIYMREDPNYEERQLIEQQKRKQAERRAAERLAEEKARAEAKRLAAERAAAMAQARRDAERIAEETAAAKARAEEETRIAAQKAREEEARRLAAAEAAAAKAKAEQEARMAAERKAKIRAIDEKYNKQYRNKGFVHSLELSYGYQFFKGDVVYENSGYREYSTLHPLSLTYTFSYRFSNWFSIGLGTGVLYNLVNLDAYAEAFDERYFNTEKFSAINIPVFANAKLYFSRGEIQPIISISGGFYTSARTVMFDCGGGCNFRLGKRGNLYILASYALTPGALFEETNWSYSNTYIPTLSFKVGFAF